MSRALFVELLGGIGDVVFILPALDALRRANPDTTWDVLTFSPGHELLDGDPRVATTYIASRGDDPVGPDEHPGCWHDLARILSESCYDLVVTDTRHSGIHDLIESCSARRVVTQLWRDARPDEPIASLFLRRLWEECLIGRPVGDGRPRLHLGSVDRTSARDAWARLDLDPRHTVILNPHSGQQIKRWALASFVELGRLIRADGLDIVILEGNVAFDAAWIGNRVPGSRILPRLPLRTTAACLEPIACLVSGDTGLAHVAAAVDTPVVTLYGPTWAGRYGVPAPSKNVQTPYACPELNPMNFTLQRCWPEDRCVIPGKRSCCDDVDVSTVLQAVRETVARSRP